MGQGTSDQSILREHPAQFQRIVLTADHAFRIAPPGSTPREVAGGMSREDRVLALDGDARLISWYNHSTACFVPFIQERRGRTWTARMLLEHLLTSEVCTGNTGPTPDVVDVAVSSRPPLNLVVHHRRPPHSGPPSGAVILSSHFILRMVRSYLAPQQRMGLRLVSQPTRMIVDRLLVGGRPVVYNLLRIPTNEVKAAHARLTRGEPNWDIQHVVMVKPVQAPRKSNPESMSVQPPRVHTVVVNLDSTLLAALPALQTLTLHNQNALHFRTRLSRWLTPGQVGPRDTVAFHNVRASPEQLVDEWDGAAVRYRNIENLVLYEVVLNHFTPKGTLVSCAAKWEVAWRRWLATVQDTLVVVVEPWSVNRWNGPAVPCPGYNAFEGLCNLLQLSNSAAPFGPKRFGFRMYPTNVQHVDWLVQRIHFMGGDPLLPKRPSVPTWWLQIRPDDRKNAEALQFVQQRASPMIEADVAPEFDLWLTNTRDTMRVYGKYFATGFRGVRLILRTHLRGDNTIGALNALLGRSGACVRQTTVRTRPPAESESPFAHRAGLPDHPARPGGHRSGDGVGCALEAAAHRPRWHRRAAGAPRPAARTVHGVRPSGTNGGRACGTHRVGHAHAPRAGRRDAGLGAAAETLLICIEKGQNGCFPVGRGGRLRHGCDGRGRRAVLDRALCRRRRCVHVGPHGPRGRHGPAGERGAAGRKVASPVDGLCAVQTDRLLLAACPQHCSTTRRNAFSISCAIPTGTSCGPRGSWSRR